MLCDIIFFQVRTIFLVIIFLVGRSFSLLSDEWNIMADRTDWSETCRKIIENQKKNKGVKRDQDVSEITLIDRKLEGVCDLAQYTNLKYIWLSNNRLRLINCLKGNFRVTELHLQYNLLKDITGALSHLTQLQVLMLQGNQLTNLEKVVKEFKKMQNLQILNMFDNPLAQEKDYRHYTIFCLPSIEILDRKEVESKERHKAMEVYDQSNERVRETVAFLRRSQGPPDLYYKRRHSMRLTTPVAPTNYLFADYKPTQSELEQEYEDRVKTKAVWTYNYFDWNKIPTPHTRRIDKGLSFEPEILSVAFK